MWNGQWCWHSKKLSVAVHQWIELSLLRLLLHRWRAWARRFAPAQIHCDIISAVRWCACINDVDFTPNSNGLSIPSFDMNECTCKRKKNQPTGATATVSHRIYEENRKYEQSAMCVLHYHLLCWLSMVRDNFFRKTVKVNGLFVVPSKLTQSSLYSTHGPAVVSVLLYVIPYIYI